MRHMNRVLVGTMLEVAAGRRTSRRSRRCSAGRPRTAAGPTAPAARPVPGSASATAARRVLDRHEREAFKPTGRMFDVAFATKPVLLLPSRGAGAVGAAAAREVSGLTARAARALAGRLMLARLTDAIGSSDVRVLLTNDDGIEAAGPAGAAARPGRRCRGRAGGDRARRQPLGDGPLDHHPPAAVGAGGRLRRRHASATPPTARPVDCVRLANLGLIEGFDGRARRLGDQPRLEPRRRHHLLGHGGGGAGGDRARAARASPSPSSRASRELDFRVGVGFDFSVAASFTARLVAELEHVPLPDGNAAERQRARRRPRRRRGRRPGQADLPRRAGARRRGRGGPAPVPDLRRRQLRARRDRAPTSPPWPPGRSPSRRSTSTSPTATGSTPSPATTWRG